MGFFDTVRDTAGALAADAERAGKVTAAQARLAVLQSDLRKAERELGHEAFALVERGELDHPDLVMAVTRLRATAAEIRTREDEIAALRGDRTPAGPTVAEIPFAVPAEPAADLPAAEAAEPTAESLGADAPGETPSGAKPGPPSTAKKAPPRKPAAKKASSKAPAGKAPAKKAPPKKPAGGKDVAGG